MSKPKRIPIPLIVDPNTKKPSLEFTIIYVAWAGFILYLLSSFIGCAHVRHTCDSYCVARGGQCDHVEQGSSRYNTKTGDVEDRPTIFVCKYNW